MSPTLFVAQHGSGFEDQFGAIICSKIDVWLEVCCYYRARRGQVAVATDNGDPVSSGGEERMSVYIAY